MNRIAVLTTPRRRVRLLVAAVCLAIAVLLVGAVHAGEATASSPAQQSAEQVGERAQAGAHRAIDATSRGLHRALDSAARGTRRAAEAVQHAFERAKNSFHSA